MTKETSPFSRHLIAVSRGKVAELEKEGRDIQPSDAVYALIAAFDYFNHKTTDLQETITQSTTELQNTLSR